MSSTLVTNKKYNPAPNIAMPPSNFAELDKLFPTNSPELGIGADASNLGGTAELGGCWVLGEGKNEEMLGAVTYGKTAGDAESVGTLSANRQFRSEKKIIMQTIGKNLTVMAAMKT
ncbi:unnamed protein product [Ilex paraguariensis]|uniref:RNase H type-1 domain-containing protein n=1 Tax=Ilex paraguariensis TaxID=185542 RepID=A0ABC8U521_9AQUA